MLRLMEHSLCGKVRIPALPPKTQRVNIKTDQCRLPQFEIQQVFLLMSTWLNTLACLARCTLCCSHLSQDILGKEFF